MTAVASLFVDTSPQEPPRAKRLPRVGAANTESERAARYLQTIDPAADVLSAVTRRSGLCNADLLGKDRHDRTALFRHAAAWLMRAYGLSFPEIGRELRRDHTTIMSGVRRLDARREKDPYVRAMTDELLIELGLLETSGPRPPTTLPTIPDLLPAGRPLPLEKTEA